MSDIAGKLGSGVCNRMINPISLSSDFHWHSAAAALMPRDIGALLLIALIGSLTNIGHAANQTWEDTHNAFIETYEIPANSGIAIAIKDNIDVAGQVTSAGSLAMAENLSLIHI